MRKELFQKMSLNLSHYSTSQLEDARICARHIQVQRHHLRLKNYRVLPTDSCFIRHVSNLSQDVSHKFVLQYCNITQCSMNCRDDDSSCDLSELEDSTSSIASVFSRKGKSHSCLVYHYTTNLNFL